MHTGRFITFEGGEGSGKSTQGAKAAERLRAAGIDVQLTREPGGSPFAEQCAGCCSAARSRRIPRSRRRCCSSAARTPIIWPAPSGRPCRRGAWVICDRFADSTRVYQGGRGGRAGRGTSTRSSGWSSSQRRPTSRSSSISNRERGSRAPPRAGKRSRAVERSTHSRAEHLPSTKSCAQATSIYRTPRARPLPRGSSGSRSRDHCRAHLVARHRAPASRRRLMARGPGLQEAEVLP